MNPLRRSCVNTTTSLKNLYKTTTCCGGSITTTASCSLICKPRSPSKLRNPALIRPPFGSSVRNFWGYGEPGGKIIPPFNFGIHFVAENVAYVVERFGKFTQVLNPGVHFLIPLVDRVAYVHSLKEQALLISDQAAITKDNVPLSINGVLYVKILDPKLASYGIEDALCSVSQLAQTTMRSQLGKITLDRTFVEREKLNKSILDAINYWPLITDWGVACLRYEIKDITATPAVQSAMELQVEAERKKRVAILSSEGDRDATINAVQGEAEAILMKAQATADGITKISQTLKATGGLEAATLKIAEQYFETFGKVAKETNILLIPSNAADHPASIVAQGMAAYKAIAKEA